MILNGLCFPDTSFPKFILYFLMFLDHFITEKDYFKPNFSYQDYSFLKVIVC